MTGLDAFAHRFAPAAPARPTAPVLLLLHGTGGNEDDLLPLGRALDSGAALLSPRGQVLEHGMPRFFRRLAEGVFDLEDLRLRTHALADFIVAAAARYGVASRPVIAVGFSNGANIAASLLLLRPGALAGAVLLSPMVPWVPEPLPALAATPVFIGAGRNDPIALAAGTERLASLLREAGADVTLHWHELGHSFGSAEVAAIRAWLSSQTWSGSG